LTLPAQQRIVAALTRLGKSDEIIQKYATMHGLASIHAINANAALVADQKRRAAEAKAAAGPTKHERVAASLARAKERAASGN